MYIERFVSAAAAADNVTRRKFKYAHHFCAGAARLIHRDILHIGWAAAEKTAF